MKTIQQFLLGGALAMLVFTSCKKDNPPAVNDLRNAGDFIQKHGPQKQSITFNTADLPKTIMLKKGTKITIPEGSLTISGTPVAGPVTMEALEFLDRKDILLGGGNTNHISGAPLHSDGFIFLDFKSNGQSVDQNLSTPVNIAIPAKREGATQLWEGVIDEDGQFGWAAPAQGNQREAKVDAMGDFRFDFGKLGWINCDIFWDYANPKTTMRVKLLNNPGAFANFRGFDGETFVFFCGKGSNVAAHIYTPDGADGVKSYDDMMPVGVEGRLLAFSIKDGRFYLAKKDIVITDGISETLTLAETTESAIQAEIDMLNDY